MTAPDPSLAEMLKSMEAETETGAAIARSIVREYIQVIGRVKQGELSSFPETLDSLTALSKRLDDALTAARATMTLDPVRHLSSGTYLRELHAAAEAAGLVAFEEEDRLLCPPSIVRAVPRELAIDIDGRRERHLHPHLVVRELARRQREPARFAHDAFLNSLRQAYDLVVARESDRDGAVVRLVDIWGVLTLLPGQAKEYNRQDFSRDLYLLDSRGATTSMQSTRQLRWCASSGTRGSGLLRTVGTDGRLRQYWGVSFTELLPEPSSVH